MIRRILAKLRRRKAKSIGKWFPINWAAFQPKNIHRIKS